MDRNQILTKIIDGAYDRRIDKFVKSYDGVFQWMIERERTETLLIKIYSFDFLLIFNDNAQILEPWICDDMILIYANNRILPRYCCTIMQWLKDLHLCSVAIMDIFIKDIGRTIISYLL